MQHGHVHPFVLSKRIVEQPGEFRTVRFQLLASGQVADEFSLGAQHGERVRTSAGLRPLASVALEPGLNAFSPELSDASIDCITTEASTFLGLVVEFPQLHVKFFAQNTVNPMGKFMDEDVLAFVWVTLEVQQIFFATTDRPRSQATSTVGPPK